MQYYKGLKQKEKSMAGLCRKQARREVDQNNMAQKNDFTDLTKKLREKKVCFSC